MNKKFINILMPAILVASLTWSAQAFALEAIPASGEAFISIDIPVLLKEVKVVFNMDHVALAGDMPIGMKYMALLSKKMKRDQATGKIIAVFHGPAAFMTLNDQSYDSNRHVTTGNPYKSLIAGLLADGVQIEECAESMKANHWGNQDLLVGVKVNTGAIARIITLTQQGYVQIQP